MKKSRKNTQRKLAITLLGVLIFGAGCFSNHFTSNFANAAEKKTVGVQHELVPHVVLPQTIQYNKIAKTAQTQPCLSHAGDYGIVSPFVATYIPFPSYDLPLTAEMRQVGETLYPASPAPKALPLPKKEQKLPQANEMDSEQTLVEPAKVFDRVKESTEVSEPILLASNNEEIVPAAPQGELNSDVQQTGIFCQRPAKLPTAWSFNTPIMKAASVPMPWGGSNMNGYINQIGCNGAGSQIGFYPMQPGVNPGGANPADPNAAFAPMTGGVPYNSFGAGRGIGDNNGVQAQLLPNGMVLLTAPSNHAQCGLLRCRCGNQPRMMLLPPSPYGTQAQPLLLPQPAGQPADPTALPASGAASMFNLPFQQFQQPQYAPVTAMTPYGMTVVGYSPVPQYQAPQFAVPQNRCYGGTGLMPQQQWAALQQLQQMQILLQAQQAKAGEQGEQKTQFSAQDGKTETAEGQAGGDLQAPLPINNPMLSAVPQVPFGYGVHPAFANANMLYASNQAAGLATTAANGAAGAATPDAVNQPLFFSLPMQQQQPFGYAPQQQPLFVQTPYGWMPVPQQPSPFGFPPAGFQQAGFGGQGIHQGGLSMSDVIQLMTLLKQSQPRRKGLFARIAERRAEKRERNTSDPFAQLMQAWSTPYNPDSSLRMPARNAYPYGYFGAQVGPQESANYGGYYNLYMGSTSYPGLY